MWALAVALSVTLITSFVDEVAFAYRNPTLHGALEIVEGMTALLTAFLLYGRYREGGLSTDLALAFVLGLLGGTNLFVSAFPTVFLQARSSHISTWSTLVCRVVAAILLARTAWSKDSRVPGSGVGAKLIAASALTLGGIVAVVWLAGGSLPDLVRTTSPADLSSPRVEGHPLLLAAQLLLMVMMGVAAAGFLRRYSSSAEDLMQWLGTFAALNAVARLNYLLFPSIYTGFVYTGDVIRLAAYLVLLIGAVREITTYWQRAAQAARLEERRRVAAELHDGIAQELVFISAQTLRLMKREPSARELQRLANAADRAVAESRRAISALSMGEQRLDEIVSELCEDTSARFRIKIDCSIQEADIDPAKREAWVRVVREALVNAAKHSAATRIAVTVETDPLMVTVTDDGVGFDEASLEPTARLGLTSMRERAKAGGAELEMTTVPGRGTTIVIRALPAPAAAEGIP